MPASKKRKYLMVKMDEFLKFSAPMLLNSIGNHSEIKNKVNMRKGEFVTPDLILPLARRAKLQKAIMAVTTSTVLPKGNKAKESMIRVTAANSDLVGELL